jgi:hypothetical protein
MRKCPACGRLTLEYDRYFSAARCLSGDCGHFKPMQEEQFETEELLGVVLKMPLSLSDAAAGAERAGEALLALREDKAGCAALAPDDMDRTAVAACLADRWYSDPSPWISDAARALVRHLAEHGVTLDEARKKIAQLSLVIEGRRACHAGKVPLITAFEGTGDAGTKDAAADVGGAATAGTPEA